MDGNVKMKDEGRKVEIKEKEVAGAGEVSLQDWIGPSDAIEGYVPRRDRSAHGEYSILCLPMIAFYYFVKLQLIE